MLINPCVRYSKSVNSLLHTYQIGLQKHKECYLASAYERADKFGSVTRRQVTLVYEQVYCTFFDVCRDLAFETQSKVLLVILSIFVTVTTPT